MGQNRSHFTSHFTSPPAVVVLHSCISCRQWRGQNKAKNHIVLFCCSKKLLVFDCFFGAGRSCLTSAKYPQSSPKLDRVASLITDPPPTSFTTLSFFCDMRHVPHATWHMIHDTQHVKYDRWEEVNTLSNFQLRSSYGLWVKVLTQRMSDWMNLSGTNVFVEQPRLNRVC